MNRPLRRRTVAALMGLAVVLTACSTQVVSGVGTRLDAEQPTTTSAPSAPTLPTGPGAPTTSPDPTASPSASNAPAACPYSDPTAGLRFGCLMNSMDDGTDPFGRYSTLLTYQTETTPDWFMSQFAARLPLTISGLAGILSADVVYLLENGYPPGSKLGTVTTKSITVGGRPAMELDTYITADKSLPVDATLKAVRDKVLIVAVDRGTTASLLEMAVPDTNQSVWPRMTAIVKTMTLL